MEPQSLLDAKILFLGRSNNEYSDHSLIRGEGELYQSLGDKIWS